MASTTASQEQEAAKVIAAEHESEEKKRPIHSFNVGPIVVSYWQYESADGRPFFKASLERYYKVDNEGRYSNQYDEHELLLMAKVAAGKAHDGLLDLKQEARAKQLNA